MIKIIKVAGSSLSPFFFPGDFVLIWRAPGRYDKLSPGDFVVFNHIVFGLLIKKITYNDPDYRYIETEGIHPDSLTTQKIGRIPYENIIGKVLLRIGRKS